MCSGGCFLSLVLEGVAFHQQTLLNAVTLENVNLRTPANPFLMVKQVQKLFSGEASSAALH